MAVQFNHTIVACKDQKKSSEFMAEMLGLATPHQFGAFYCVDTENSVSLDFMEVGDGNPVRSQHYAFLISEDEFDSVLGRIKEKNLEYWADPFRKRPGEINTNDGGRGVYFCDPDGHLLEVLTRPYGSGGLTGTPASST